MEELRQPVVDRLVIRLFNKQMFTEADFDLEADAVVLGEEGFRKFCKEYEKWMTDKFFADSSKAFRSVLKEQAHLLKCAIQNREEYKPYRWGTWQVRSDVEQKVGSEMDWIEDAYPQEQSNVKNSKGQEDSLLQDNEMQGAQSM